MSLRNRDILIYIIVLTSFFSCKQEQGWKIANLESDTERFSTNKLLETDPEVEALIAPYRAELSKKMDIQIGMLETTLNKARPEGTLGNWIADLVKTEAEKETGEIMDFGVHNYGGLRVTSVSTGPFLVGEAYEIMPFDNTLIALRTHGDTVRMLMERIADYGGWPVSKELKITIQDTVLSEVLINGEEIDDNREYLFAVPDYVANGGDKCDFLIGTRRISTDLYVREAIINHVKDLTSNGKAIKAKLENRVKML